MGIFNRADRDCDGAITLQEWISVFRDIDRNGNGSISRKEWHLANGTAEMFDKISTRVKGNLSMTNWRQAFEDLDADGNGTISLNEWLDADSQVEDSKLMPCPWGEQGQLRVSPRCEYCGQHFAYARVCARCIVKDQKSRSKSPRFPMPQDVNQVSRFRAVSEDTLSKATCPKGHVLKHLGKTQHDGWICDGCGSGYKDPNKTRGMSRFTCDFCDYDLCEACCKKNAFCVATKVDDTADSLRLSERVKELETERKQLEARNLGLRTQLDALQADKEWHSRMQQETVTAQQVQGTSERDAVEGLSELLMGSTVKVIHSFEGNNDGETQRTLCIGECGSVRHIDEDGDALIAFDSGDQWVFQRNSFNLRVTTREERTSR